MIGQSSSDIEWLIVLAFPNGGSTAIARVFLTADRTVALQQKAEGQWLVPEMSESRVRWDAKMTFDYDAIRTRWIEAVWQNTAVSAADQAPPLVIEKSPPNICRHQAIVSMLKGMKVDTVVMTRDPYATCASWHVRYGREMIEQNWGWAGDAPTDEDSYFNALGKLWLRRAKYLDTARADAKCCIRYEDFADNPSLVVGQIAQKIPRLRTAVPDARIRVKDYRKQKVRNMNKDQISVLTTNQMNAIHSALSEDPELVTGFGYDVTPPDGKFLHQSIFERFRRAIASR